MKRCGLVSQGSWIVSVVLLAVALTGCDGKNSNTIVVGEYGSLHGSEATFGQSTDNGIRLAVEEINNAGGINGKKIDLRVEDVKGSIDEVGRAVTSLISKDKSVAILGEVASSLSKAGASICQKKNVPMITPSSTNPSVTQKGNMIFRACFTDDFQGYAMARFASEELKAKTAVLLEEQGSAYSQGLVQFITKEFTGMGGKVVGTYTYSKGAGDFGGILNNVKEANPDVVFIPGYYTDVATIARQARERGITATLVGGDGWESKKLTEIAGPAIQGQYYTNHCSFDDPKPKAFVDKYKAKYGEEPDSLAALGYDAANILFDAMKRAKSLSSADLAEAIAQTRDFPGVAGTVTIDANRNASKQIVVIQIKGDRRETVKRYDPR